MKKCVYADFNATTPSTNEHHKKVFHLLNQVNGNPSSLHQVGREAKLLMEESREKVSALFGAPKNHILFTSGATESNNLILQGHTYESSFPLKRRPKLLISAGEHSSVHDTAEVLYKRGLCDLSFIPLNRSGFVDTEKLLQTLQEDCTLVSLIHVNNETGAISPITELTHEIKKKAPQAHVHVDAVQSYGKLDLRFFHKSLIDSASASGHKIGALKGIGCLYFKRNMHVSPLILGGGQERAWRSGTENLPGLISFGIRAEELAERNYLAHAEELRGHFLKGLREIPQVSIHGQPESCLGTTINFHIDRFSAEELLLAFDTAGVCVSNGSACSSGGGRPSRVLQAMGFSDEIAANSVRVSFGEASSFEDVTHILKTLLDLVRSKKRRISE